MKDKILVTGGCGYIGSAISSKLLKNYEVIVLDNLSNSSKKTQKKNIKFYKLDLSNYLLLKKFLKKNQFKTIIHLAAKKNVIESDSNKNFYYKENFINTKNLFDIAIRNNLRSFIFFSSAAVYGKGKTKILSTANLKPLSYYGKTKLLSEKYLIKQLEKFNFKLSILRLFNAAGADCKKKIGNQSKKDIDLFSHIIRSFEEDKKFSLFGKNFDTKDGTCIRNFIHINDISNIVIKIIDYLKTAKYQKFLINICSQKSYSILDVIKAFQIYYKKKLDYNLKNKRKSEIVKSTASYNFIKGELQYKCKFSSIENLVKSSVFWYRLINIKQQNL